jgi:hypothetical protein
MKLVDKILHEASFENDAKTVLLLKQYFQKAEEIIKMYDGKDSKYLTYNVDKKSIDVNLGKLIFTFYAYDSSDLNAINYGSRYEGLYLSHKNPPQILVFKCKFTFNKGKLNIEDLNLSSAFHEVVHAFDAVRTKGKNAMGQQAKKVNDSKTSAEYNNKYANNPYEFNAFFMETLMPLIEKYLVSGHPFEHTFEDFKKYVIQQYNSNGGQSFNMNDDMKKKFLKRIYAIYQGFKKEVKVDLKQTDETLQNLDMDKVNKKMKATIFSKIKNALGIY